MSHPNFQRKAIAAAISSIIMGGTVGTAMAVTIVPTDTRPQLKGSLFLGGPSTQVRITSAAPTDDLVEARIHYYDAAMTFISSTIPVADSSGAAIEINLTVNAPAGATHAVVTVDTSMSADDIGGADFGYILADGTVVNAGGSPDFESDQRDAAVVAGALHPINAAYSEISITNAKVDVTGATNSIVYVTFNADPVGFAGAGIAATDFVNIVAGLASVAKTVSDGTAGTPGEPLDANEKALLEDTEAVGALLPPPALTAFAGSVQSVSNAVMLDDGAGNVPTAGNTIGPPVAALGAPAYRPTGMVAIATGTADDLWGDMGAGAVTVNIGLDSEPDPASWDAADDLVVSDPGVLKGGFGVATDANGEDTILTATLTPPAGQKFFFSTNPGDLLMGTDRDDAEANPAITVNVTDGATPLALKLNPSVTLDTNAMVGDEFLGAETVVAGVAQTPVVATRDSNLDGWIDGSTIDFRQSVDSVPTNIGLISYTGTPTMAVADRVVLATGAAAFETGSMTLVNVDLTTPDIPLPDGTAPPGNANNDYNGDGLEDDVDQAFVIEENFNTGVDATFASPGVPWEAMIGTNDLATPVTSGLYEFVWNALTGGQLAVSTGNHLITVDGAAPVVQSVTYTEVIDAAAAEAMGVDRSGTVTIKASELVQVLGTIADAVNDTINEFLFDGIPSDLLNLAATIAEQVAIAIDDLIGDMTIADSDEITLTNLPRAALIDDVGGGAANAVLSLGATGAATDVNGAPLFIAAGAVASATVVEGAPAGPVLTGGSFVEIGGEWQVCAMFDQDLVAPAGQVPDDLNQLFTVRALIGFGEVGQSSSSAPEGPDTLVSTDTALFQFVIAGADVTVGSALCGGTDDKVLLEIPSGLPADTVKIWIDTQPATDAEIMAGSLRYVANADGVPNQGDGGTQFDDDPDAPGNNVKVAHTLSGDPATLPPADPNPPNAIPDINPTVNDEDTVMVDGNTAPFFNNNGIAGSDSRVLFTKTVRGTAVHAGVPYPPDTAIRADLIRVMPMAPEWTAVTTKAKVGDGWIDVRQGSNSEYNENCNCRLESWITVALLNDGAVTGSDFDAFDKLHADAQDAEAAFQSAVANQKSFAAQDELRQTWIKLQQRLEKRFSSFDTEDGDTDYGKPLFVAVTNGSGRRAPDGTGLSVAGADDDNEKLPTNSAQANGNASFGRTATLLDHIPNQRQNGTSYYPVILDMMEGELKIPESWGDDTNNLGHGFLEVEKGQSSADSSYAPVYEVLDTAYALTMGDEGMYQITVGVDEQTLTGKSKELVAQNSTICTMISILPSNVRDEFNWVHTTSCDPSFNAFIEFVPDLATDGSGMIHNIDTANIAMAYVFDDADWNLLAVAGTPDRDDSVPLDPSWFWIQPWPESGRPSTIWGMEGAFGDAMFTMKDSKMELAFEIGDASDNATVGKVTPFPGGALGYKGDGNIWDQQDSDSTPPPGVMDAGYCGDDSPSDFHCTKGKIYDDDSSPDYRKVWVPVTGGPQDATLEEGWSLVTVGEGRSVDDLVSAHPQIDAVIIFNSPAPKGAAPEDDVVDNMSGRDDDGDMQFDGTDDGEMDPDDNDVPKEDRVNGFDTIVWFSGDTAPVSTFSGPVAAFIHANGTITGYNVGGGTPAP